jgi:hypothetical protein
MWLCGCSNEAQPKPIRCLTGFELRMTGTGHVLLSDTDVDYYDWRNHEFHTRNSVKDRFAALIRTSRPHDLELVVGGRTILYAQLYVDTAAIDPFDILVDVPNERTVMLIHQHHRELFGRDRIRVVDLRDNERLWSMLYSQRKLRNF